MTRTDPTRDIRTRPDGSIDLDHYMSRSRTLRSRQAHGLTRAFFGRRA